MSEELAFVSSLAQKHGFTLDPFQPHVSGERFLMQAMTTVAGEKFILLATANDGQRVVLKITKNQAGKNEIEKERLCRTHINQLAFAYNVFEVPTELFHIIDGDYLINAQLLIPQETPFLARPIKEQFDYALKAFSAQEHSRATTSAHLTAVKKIFGVMTTPDYLATLSQFLQTHEANTTPHQLLTAVGNRLEAEQRYISQYSNFLAHTDFVPHNFRIHNDKIYLLDFSSIRFGNKHESWARFLNFMTLYHPELEAAFMKYFDLNRAKEERQSLILMRLYRLAEIITYYQNTLRRSTGNLLTLNETRVGFWSTVLEATLEGKPLEQKIRTSYIATRDRLRSDDEKKRQKDLH